MGLVINLKLIGPKTFIIYKCLYYKTYWPQYQVPVVTQTIIRFTNLMQPGHLSGKTTWIFLHLYHGSLDHIFYELQMSIYRCRFLHCIFCIQVTKCKIFLIFTTLTTIPIASNFLWKLEFSKTLERFAMSGPVRSAAS